jgi:GNAT superfamily N-acetyltransferase
MHIQRVDVADRRDVRRFLDLPFRLYRDQPLWVPPFAHEARSQLDPRRHPFYQHSEAAFFLAMDGREAVGRIAMLDNARYNAHHKAHTAFFYLFDAVDDQAVGRSLFDAAGDWARSRGLDHLWGPKGFSHIEGQGILVEGFEHRPAMGVPYNHPYYGALVEAAGLTKKFDFFSFHMDRQFHFPERYLEAAEKLKQRRGFRSVTYRTKDELRALIPRVVQVYNEAFVEVQGYTPMTEAEGKLVGERVLSVADPALISLLWRGDEIVGFVIAFPDLSAAVQRCRGRLWPLGWLYLMREFKRTRWLNFNSIGIREGSRGLGGTALLYSALYHTLIDHPQYDFADMVQVQETNERTMREYKVLGVESHKRHRMYEIALG